MDTLQYEHDHARLTLHLFSDAHIGSAHTDYARLAADIDRVKRDPLACLAIAGDVFDAIIPSDDKRFRIETLHPRVRGDDTLNRAIDWAAELFTPVADKILFIAPGNHDEKTKRHGLNVIGTLTQRLNVREASYAGVLTVKLPHKQRLNIGWWHGYGGGGSRQAAVKQSGRLLDVFEGLDVAWTGHRHQRYAAPTVRYAVGKRGVRERRTWLVMSGAYLRGAKYAIEQLHSIGDIGSVVLDAVAGKDGVKTEVLL